MVVLEWIAMASGSVASAKRSGEPGQPCLHSLDNENGRVKFVKILASGALKSVLCTE